jgi:hypothetical protein
MFIDGTCEYWTNWSEPLALGRDVFVVKWIFYIAWAVSCMEKLFILRIWGINFECMLDMLCWNMRLLS